MRSGYAKRRRVLASLEMINSEADVMSAVVRYTRRLDVLVCRNIASSLNNASLRDRSGRTVAYGRRRSPHLSIRVYYGPRRCLRTCRLTGLNCSSVVYNVAVVLPQSRRLQVTNSVGIELERLHRRGRSHVGANGVS